MRTNFTGIKETCLYVSNLNKTEEFYKDKLELSVISKVKDRHIFFRAGNSVLLCFIANATRKDERLPPHWGKGELHFAFSVPPQQYNLWKAHILEKDIEIEHEEAWSEALRSFYFRDPDNHCVEIVMDGMWESN